MLEIARNLGRKVQNLRERAKGFRNSGVIPFPYI